MQSKLIYLLAAILLPMASKFKPGDANSTQTAAIGAAATESITIPLSNLFTAQKTEWNDPQYYGRVMRYEGFPLEDLLLANPKFKDLLSKIQKYPNLAQSYIVLFHTKDKYLPAMELGDVLDCTSNHLPQSWFHSPVCTTQLSSGFIATRQINRTTNSTDCQFDPVADRLPEKICAGDYYLVWPRLALPKYEFKAPYQLVSIEITPKRSFYDADVYPDLSAVQPKNSNSNAAAIQRGADHYLRYCSSCHSVNLKPIERSRSFDFVVPTGIATLMTAEKLTRFLYSKTPPPGAQSFDPEILTRPMIADLFTYFSYMESRKKCVSLLDCTAYCRKNAGASADTLCTSRRFLQKP
jgi:hypothetical protein